MVIFGRLVDQEGLELGSVMVIERGWKGEPVRPDAYGRFRLTIPDDFRVVHLAIERDGEIVLDRAFEVDDIRGDLVIELPSRGRELDDAVSVAIAAARERPAGAELLDRLTESARRLDIDERSLEAAGRLVRELDELARDALPAVSGDTDAIARVLAALEPEIPFDFDLGMNRFKPYPGDYGLDPCAVVPRSPWSLVQVGMAIDGGHGNAWAGRAVTAILRRAEPATRLQRAVSAFEAGQVGEDVLQAALSFAAEVEGRGPSFGPVWDTLRDGSPGRFEPETTMGRGPSGAGPEDRLGSGPRPPFGAGLTGFRGWPDLPGRPSLGTLLDPCNLEWLECAHTFVTTPPARTPPPPAVGMVDPTDIMAGQPAQLTLTPPAGTSFPAQRHAGWSFALDGTLLTIDSWSQAEIVLDVPALPPGCRRLMWLVDQHDSAEFFNLQTEACARFFGGRRPLVKPILPVGIDRISVVGSPSIRSFTANNVAPKLLAEGCTTVQLGWLVDPLVCSGSAAVLAVELRDDSGTVLAQGPLRSGAIPVTEQRDRVYTLTAANTLRGVAAGTATSTLDVERYQRLISLSKTSPSGPVQTGATVTIEATLSCPADDPVQVVITSSRPDRCPGLTITVPVGQSKASGQVSAGGSCGNVTLSGVVQGVNHAPVQASFLVHDPRLDALVGSSLEQCDGGTVTVRVACAASVSSVLLNGPGGSIPARAAPQLAASIPSDPASGTIQAVASFGSLAAGTYAVQVIADGVTVSAGNVNVVLGPPTVSLTASPTAIQVCAATQVTLTASARRATELSITRSDGTVIGGPVTGSDPCGALTATATVPVTQKTTFKAVAKRQGASNVTTDVTIQETTSVPTATKATVYNTQSGSTVLYIYVQSVKPGQAVASTTRLGQISPTQQLTYSPVQCEVFELWGLLSDDASLVGTTNFHWRSSVILGHPSGATPTFWA